MICPAAQGKLRCPHQPQSLTLPEHDRPTILDPPEHPPVCCTQQTFTVPPTVNAKTAQKHDYPSPQHRTSYNRRTAAERTFAPPKDPASTDILPRLVPTDGPHRKRPIHRHRADRPQPPRGRRPRRPPSRKSATRSLRAAAQTTQTPTADDPRPRRDRARALTRRATPPRQPPNTPAVAPTQCCPSAPPPGQSTTKPRPRATTKQPSRSRQPTRGSVRPKREHQRPSNVKTSRWPWRTRTSNLGTKVANLQGICRIYGLLSTTQCS